jgi:hypothetical protein
MTNGSVRVSANASLVVASADYQSNELTGSSFILEDGSTFSVGSYEPVHLTFSEFDLDGENGGTLVEVGANASLTVHAAAIDNDADSPGFNGEIRVPRAARVHMNIAGGWILNGRLAIGDGGTLEGTTMTVDSNGQDDGIVAGGGDFRDATIVADLILTENARISAPYGYLNFEGNVTSYRHELGTPDGWPLVFAGDVTTFAVPTILQQTAILSRGTAFLNEDVVIDDTTDFEGTPTMLIVSQDARLGGEGKIIVEGQLRVSGGTVVDVPIVNRGTLEHIPSLAESGRLTELDQLDDGEFRVLLQYETPVRDAALYVERARLDGKLIVQSFALPGRRFDIISAAENGITGRFSTYELPALQRGIWKVDYGASSVALEIVDRLSGDYNGNGIVEQGDLDLVLLHWGAGAMTAPERWVNDLPSGLVDQDELDRVLLGWGDLIVRPQAEAVSVPEPGAVCVLAVSLLALGIQAPRRRTTRGRNAVKSTTNTMPTPVGSGTAAAEPFAPARVWPQLSSTASS